MTMFAKRKEGAFRRTRAKAALQAGIAVMALALAVQAQADDAAALILPERIVEDTLTHSFRLRSAELDVAVSEAAERRARAGGLPSLDVEARATRFEGLRGFVLGPELSIPEIANRYDAVVTLTQPLYTGGRISQEKQSASFGRGAAEAARRSTETGVTLDALTAYWNWSKAHYALESLRASVERMEAHSEDVDHLRDAGLATKADSLATQVRLEQTRLLYEEAQRRVGLARARIAFLTGKDLPETAVPKEAESFVPEIPGEDEGLAVAETNRAEREARRLELAATESRVRAARSGLLPHLYITAAYEQARPNELIFPPEDKFQDIAYAGLALRWNLLDWGLTRAGVDEARSRAQQAALRLEQTNERIRLDVREARVDLQNAVARVEVNRRARESAQLNVRTSTDLWQNGLARHAEVLDAHAELRDAEYQLIVSRADVRLAEARLNYAMGRLDVERSAGEE